MRSPTSQFHTSCRSAPLSCANPNDAGVRAGVISVKDFRDTPWARSLPLLARPSPIGGSPGPRPQREQLASAALGATNFCPRVNVTGKFTPARTATVNTAGIESTPAHRDPQSLGAHPPR